MTTIATAAPLIAITEAGEEEAFQPSTAAYAGYKVGEDFWCDSVSFTNEVIYNAFWMPLPEGLDPDGDEFFHEVCRRYYSYDNDGAAFTHFLAIVTQTESCLDFDNYDKAESYCNAISDQSADRDEFGGVFYWDTKKNPFPQALQVFRSLIAENKEFAGEHTYEEEMAEMKRLVDLL